MKNDNRVEKQLVNRLTELGSLYEALKKSITDSISAEFAAEEARRFAERIVETVRESLLVLDADLKIISANRNFYRTFKVTPGETIGNFIYDLGNKQWDIPKLRELLEEVLRQKTTLDNYEVEHDFATIRRIMLLNARQIKKASGKEQIILLAIEDITERREIENRLEKVHKELEASKISEDAAIEYAADIINTVREPLIALDQDLRVVTASRSFYDAFKVKSEETVGQLIYDLGNKQWAIPKLRELLETILPQKATFDDYEVEHDFTTIGRRIMLLNARQIQRVLGKERIILLAIEDITERREAEEVHRKKQAVEQIRKARKALGATIQAIIMIVETRDPYTAGHQRRVSDLARAIATEMNLPIDMIDGIRMAAAIHDLGKIYVPVEILSNPTKLTNIEFNLIKIHPQSGYDILKDIDFPWPIARIVLEHHERMNGSGYPNGLAGDNILMESRILSVADVVEAMASYRPYRPALGIDAALEEIEKNKGTLYDNTVAAACLRLFREKGYQLQEY
jgi:PAS domain S-box-containing protein